jgi:hypothetical protein
MVENLKSVIEVLLQNIYNEGDEKLADQRQVIELINKIGQQTRLSLMFNVKHNLKEHKQMYTDLRYCDQEHCFECLYEKIEDGFEICDHNQKLTRYEVEHIKWLNERIDNS